MPVFGLACSQKNKKFALSRSFKNWSSSGLRENAGSSGGGESCGGGDCAKAVIIPDAGTQRPAARMRRMNSRRGALLWRASGLRFFFTQNYSKQTLAGNR